VNSATPDPYGSREVFVHPSSRGFRELLAELEHLFVKFLALLPGLFRELRT